jgi:hypothetical protein
MTTKQPNSQEIHQAGTYENINPANIVITNLGNQRQPRLCVFDKVYPISLEFEGRTPFGIDLIFGKQYLKITVLNSMLSTLLRNIDIRLMNLVPGLKSAVFGANNIQTVLDRDIEIVDEDGKEISSYAICKGSFISVIAELGNIYSTKGAKANEHYYKWLVKKIILYNNPPSR